MLRLSGVVGSLLVLAYLSGRGDQAVHPDHRRASERTAVQADEPHRADRGAPSQGPATDEPSGARHNGVRHITYEAFPYAFAPDPLIVRASERVSLRVLSRDLQHGLAIPAIGFESTVPMTEQAGKVFFTAPEEPGQYPIYSSVTCGRSHGSMQGTLMVLPAAKHEDD